jgi:poly-gamma-glutamate synthesis protein (capsule biosynthesis protein)
MPRARAVLALFGALVGCATGEAALGAEVWTLAAVHAELAAQVVATHAEQPAQAAAAQVEPPERARCCSPPEAQAHKGIRLLFTGDIMLSREVEREMAITRRSPWSNLAPVFADADWIAGNLEGAVGQPGECPPAATGSPCFAIAAERLHWAAAAGFGALSLANNHAGDLGPPGLAATRDALRGQGIVPLEFDSSPHFVRLGGHTVAVIAVSLVAGRDGARQRIPSTALRQKIRLARGLAELVVVSVHWGNELLDWPVETQREAARWLVEAGVDLVVGHHPHVVQPPECVRGRPVFYSLGNHVFDQKYEESKRGMIADCRIAGGALRCGAMWTVTPAASAFPALADSPGDAPAGAALSSCIARLGPTLAAGGYTLRGRDGGSDQEQPRYVVEGTVAPGRSDAHGDADGERDALGRRVAPDWESRPLRLLSAEVGRLDGMQGPEYLLTLERHPSPLDSEDGVRPYVYEVRASGLVARWRGSALAWPLLDAALLPGGIGVVCALHRGDSFLELAPGAKGLRVAAYRWNGFGFSGVADPVAGDGCRSLFSNELRESGQVAPGADSAP